MTRNLIMPLATLSKNTCKPRTRNKNTKTQYNTQMLTQRVLSPTRLTACLRPMSMPLLTLIHHHTIKATISTTTTRPFSTTIILKSYPPRGPPRFQTGPPSGFFSHLWSIVPDGAKTALAVIGGCATLMVIGPLFFLVAPPLFAGGLLLVTRRLRKKEKDMSKRWEALESTKLVYPGTFDLKDLEKFVTQRVMDAIKTNENEILNALNVGPDLKVSLTKMESVDQDMRISRNVRLSRDTQSGTAIHSISIFSYGLLDCGTNNKFNRIGSVLITLKPALIDPTEPKKSAADCIIEVVPLMPFRNPVVLDTPSESNWGSSGRILDLKPKNTQSKR